MNKINLVNSISFFRLFSAPVILWMILEDKLLIAFWIFFLAALSDTIDGFLARKLKLVTEFGKILDPLSDKILIFSVFISLSYKDMLAVPIIIIWSDRKACLRAPPSRSARSGMCLGARLTYSDVRR